MKKTIRKKNTKWYNIKSLIDSNTTFHMLLSARKAGKQKRHS